MSDNVNHTLRCVMRYIKYNSMGVNSQNDIQTYKCIASIKNTYEHTNWFHLKQHINQMHPFSFQIIDFKLDFYQIRFRGEFINFSPKSGNLGQNRAISDNF